MASVKPPSRQDFFLQETKGGLRAVPLKWYHRIAKLLPPWSGIYGSGKVHLLVKNELAKIEKLKTSAERLKALSQLKVTVETVKDSHRYVKKIGSLANKNFAKVLGEIDMAKLDEEAKGLSLESLLNSIERKDTDQEKYKSALKELIEKERATVKTILTENAPLFEKFVKIQTEQDQNSTYRELINEVRRKIIETKKDEIEALMTRADQAVSNDELKEITANVLQGEYTDPEKQFLKDADRGVVYSLENRGSVTKKLEAPQGLENDEIKGKYLESLINQFNAVFMKDEDPWRALALTLASQTPLNAIGITLQQETTQRFADSERSSGQGDSLLYIASVQKKPIELTLVRNEEGKIGSISLKTSIWNPIYWTSVTQSKEMNLKAQTGESFDKSGLVGYIKTNVEMSVKLEATQESNQIPIVTELKMNRKLEEISS